MPPAIIDAIIAGRRKVKPSRRERLEKSIDREGAGGVYVGRGVGGSCEAGDSRSAEVGSTLASGLYLTSRVFSDERWDSADVLEGV